MADADKLPFEPNPLWVTGTVETNGTGGDETTEKVTPTFEKARAEALARAAEDPSDESVILPEDNDDLDDDEAIKRLKDAAEEAGKGLDLDVDKDGAQDDVEDQVVSSEKAAVEANGGEAQPTDAKVNPHAERTDETSVTKAEVDHLAEKPGPRKRNTSK